MLGTEYMVVKFTTIALSENLKEFKTPRAKKIINLELFMISSKDANI